MVAPRFLLSLLFLLSVAVWGNEEQARELLRAGQAQQALTAASGDSPAARLLRAQAHLDLRQYQEAARALDSVDQRGLSKAERFGLLVTRGRLERARGELEQARQWLLEAERSATLVNQRLRALDESMLLLMDLEDESGLQKTLEKSEGLVPQIEDRATLAGHLETIGRIQQWRGQRPEAAVSFSAARSLWDAAAMPARAARVTLWQAELLERGGDLEGAWSRGGLALRESLETGDLEHALLALHYTSDVTMRLPGRRPDQLVRLSTTMKGLPEGYWQSRARGEWARHLMNAATDPAGVEALLRENLAQPELDRRNRVWSLHMLAVALGHAGRYEEARELLEQALALAEPTLYLDWYNDTSPGPILLSRGHHERQQHQVSASLRTLRQALAAQPQPDWRPWRTQVHYAGLLAASDVYDVEAAREHFQGGLENLLGLQKKQEQATSLHRLMAALLLNQSQNDDLIDPAQRALGRYDTLAQTLLEDMLSPPGSLDRYLEVYDGWIEQLRAERDETREPVAMIYKAIFLEAAGRLAEARAQCIAAIEKADRRRLDYPRALGRLILARVELASGRRESAGEILLEAREAVQDFAPSVQLYELLYASHQLQRRNFTEALAGYDRSLASAKDKGWRGQYGRALALEGLARPEEALGAVRLAQASIQGDRPFSRAALKALEGRLLLSLGRAEEALPSLASSYQTLMESDNPPTLAEVAKDYGDALLAAGRKSEALRISRQALDLLLSLRGSAGTSGGPLFERVAELSLESGDLAQAMRYLELSRSAELVGSVSLSKVEHGDPKTRELLSELERLKTRLERLQTEAGATEQGDRRAGFSRLMATTRQEFFAKLDELKAREPDFEALVQLSGSDLSAISAQLEPDEALIEYFPSESTLYLIVVTAERFRLHEVRIGRPALNALVRDYLRELHDPESNQDRLAATSHTLHGLLIEPAFEELAGHRRWRVVPSGTLWHIPFEELRDKRGRSLNEAFEISLLTSADLLRALARRDGVKRGDTLLVGAPEGEDLQGARRELDLLHQLLPSSAILSGPRATAAALRQKLPSVGTLHIASHSGLGQQPGQGYIALADGPLTAEQIYGLSLRPGALVVLSSCRSGVGESSPGRELTSLASAFNIAGASTVIASHWEVDDEVTTRLMLSFYRQLEAGRDRGEALRLARQELARSYPHPYYWAAFSLFGSPR